MTVGVGTGRNILSISKSSKDRIEGINNQGSQDLPKDSIPIFHGAVKIEYGNLFLGRGWKVMWEMLN